jgi:hypothetical protein
MQDADDSQRKQLRRQSLPPLFLLLLLHAGCLFFATYRHTWLPQPVPATDPPSQFSKERVRNYLNDIMQFGVRVVGSEANEKLTPAYLVQQVEAIQARSPSRKIDIDIQHPSGSFWVDFIGGMTNSYTNVTNVLVSYESTPLVFNGKLLLMETISLAYPGQLLATSDSPLGSGSG